MGEGPFLTGSSLTLADLHAAPMFGYFATTPESETLLEGRGPLRAWWERMASRPSMALTAAP